MDDQLTGLVLAADDAQAWADAVVSLLGDDARRLRMSRTTPLRVARCNPGRTFDAYWDEHVKAAQDAAAAAHAAAAPAAPAVFSRPQHERAVAEVSA